MPYRFSRWWIVGWCSLLVLWTPWTSPAVETNTCGVDPATLQRDRGSPDVIGIVTGPPGGTFARFGQDIAAMVQAVPGVRLRMDVRESQGGLQNICRIASQENAAFGLVYADTLGFLKRLGGRDLDAIANKLRLVFPLYESEVHVFAQKRIKNIPALRHERVLFNVQGSNSWITTHNLLRLLDIQLENAVEKPLEEGINDVLNNQAAAYFFVGGKPVPAFQNLAKRQQHEPGLAAKLSQVHFVPIDDERILRRREYVSATLGPQDATGAEEYAWLPGPAKIATVSIRTLLVSFAFSSKTNAYATQRCEAMRTVTQAIREAVQTLQTSDKPSKWHNKWREVDLGEYVSIWQQETQCTSRSLPAVHPREAFIVNVIKKYMPFP